MRLFLATARTFEKSKIEAAFFNIHSKIELKMCKIFSLRPSLKKHQKAISIKLVVTQELLENTTLAEKIR